MTLPLLVSIDDLDVALPTIIVERNERPGDSWRKRYKSLCLHDPVWYDHLPYIDFPRNWPVFAPKDKIGDWLEMYAKVMELNYWSSTEARSASYDDKKKEWTVVVRRDGKDITLRPKQLVLATGMSAVQSVPRPMSVTLPPEGVCLSELSSRFAAAYPAYTCVWPD